MLGLAGFDQDTVEVVRAECPTAADVGPRLDNRARVVAIQTPTASVAGFERVADVPIYFADALVRQAPSLMLTADARAPRARMNAADLQRLGAAHGAPVRIANGAAAVVLGTLIDAGVPAGCVRLAGGHALTAPLGALTGNLSVEPA